MVSRLISANTSEILNMTKEELKQSIKASEGRVIVSEVAQNHEPIVGDISHAELSNAYGADMILLNNIDLFNPQVWGVKDQSNFVEELHHLVGCPIGVNLEPVDENADMAEDRDVISKGRQLNKETLEVAEKMGLDFICLTGNPGTGVTNQQIINALEITSKYFSGLVIAGKMHGSGVSEAVITKETVKAFVEAGADVILVPAVGTVPGFTDSELIEIVKYTHEHDALVLSAIGTSQEGSQSSVIEQFAIRNKVCGVDIQHIGDAAYGGIAPLENIYTLSKAIRGIRHTASRMARSINR
ncbi:MULTISPECIES: haloacid dehalogenase-like hydrolase [Aerococcus]|uniref:DUF7916 family protein n=1 Tax=Aerococcus TaxID=1375 RepID=UPI000DCEE43C|nr:haloacid dehalogenase-like hydrolase [Aerococcus urinae]RAV94302.1 haloacid dehalogenase-like hydrolase [Aerococcus mictus]MDK6375287.1 haloacid dehalogenase-like hydrolase [Aerococcus urinae]MDK6420135.1 haloacid dehalogenase-like hydrolase [Aerococcus urinae]MDK8075628.1 haloacid dehalogenase-like hydrolase [Aerococcus urinae]MDK8084603.1 haloacid dehalogenase-like hydrolase [Aerococcus urinae]